MVLVLVRVGFRGDQCVPVGASASLAMRVMDKLLRNSSFRRHLIDYRLYMAADYTLLYLTTTTAAPFGWWDYATLVECTPSSP